MGKIVAVLLLGVLIGFFFLGRESEADRAYRICMERTVGAFEKSGAAEALKDSAQSALQAFADQACVRVREICAVDKLSDACRQVLDSTGD